MANEGQSQQPETDKDPAGSDGDGFDAAFEQRSNAEDQTGEDGRNVADGESQATNPSHDANGPSDDGQEAKPPVEQQFDPYAGLTPAQDEHFRRLEQSERSQRGRVGALTQKINRVTAATVPQQNTQASQSEPADQGPSMEDLMAQVAKAAEEYPDAVGPLKDVIEQMGQQVNRISEQIQPMTAREQEQALVQAYDTLAGDHPDYAEIGQSQEFHSWFAEQPEGVKALANSLDPKEVSLALTVFKAETGRITADPQQPQQSAQHDTAARRERQLEGARDVSSRGAPVSSGTPNDFDAAFDSRVKRFKA